VVETFAVDYDGELVSVHLESEVIEATSTHPFWVVEGVGLSQRRRPTCIPEQYADKTLTSRWVEAGELKVGDRLLLRSGALAPVKRIVARQSRLVVYTLGVQSVPTFCVGLKGVVVHNKLTGTKNIRRGVLILGDGGSPVPLDCSTWAKNFAKKNGGTVMHLKPKNGLRATGYLPGENKLRGDYQYHSVVIKDGKLYDGLHPKGIEVGEWTRQFRELNHWNESEFKHYYDFDTTPHPGATTK
jgi:hypothetical protein